MKFTQRLALTYIRTKFRILSFISKEKAASAAFELFCTPQSRSMNPKTPLFASATTIRLRYSDYDIVGYRWNEGGRKKVLILHGYESAASNFEPFINPLLEKGYEVFAFDAPAHGSSSGTSVNALIYADLIVYLQETYGPFHSFLAHSFGGIALSLALERFAHDSSTRVALVAPATETPTAIRQFFRVVGINDPVVLEKFNAIILRISGRPVEWFSISRAIRQISATILWVHDEKDNITPISDARKIMDENHPSIQFVITTGLGHSRIYRDGEIGKMIVHFL